MNKAMLRPADVETFYGIPRGSLAAMRYKKEGPRFFKAGKRRILYRVEDIENWINQNPALTADSIKANE